MEKKVCVNNLKLSIFASACERFCISNCAAAALPSALLVDTGLVTRGDDVLVVDKNKV